MRCRAYAKALHYKEEEFHRSVTTDTLESLISINNKLQQPESAAGVLDYAMKYHKSEVVSCRAKTKYHIKNNQMRLYFDAF